MNSRYFGCPIHKHCVEAGYRWAYWTLEDKGIVSLGEVVDVMAVLSAKKYWNPPDNGINPQLITEVLPKVKRFLVGHESDGIMYFDEEFLFERWELGYEWRTL